MKDKNLIRESDTENKSIKTSGSNSKTIEISNNIINSYFERRIIVSK